MRRCGEQFVGSMLTKTEVFTTNCADDRITSSQSVIATSLLVTHASVLVVKLTSDYATYNRMPQPKRCRKWHRCRRCRNKSQRESRGENGGLVGRVESDWDCVWFDTRVDISTWNAESSVSRLADWMGNECTAGHREQPHIGAYFPLCEQTNQTQVKRRPLSSSDLLSTRSDILRRQVETDEMFSHLLMSRPINFWL